MLLHASEKFGESVLHIDQARVVRDGKTMPSKYQRSLGRLIAGHYAGNVLYILYFRDLQLKLLSEVVRAL